MMIEKSKYRQSFAVFLGLLVLVISGVATKIQENESIEPDKLKARESVNIVAETIEDENIVLVSGVFAQFLQDMEQSETVDLSIPLVSTSGNQEETDSENEIYTFLQGPRAWGSQMIWSGEWAYVYVNGNSFGGFGCGLVCMANVYSTLSEYEASPLDMLEFAQRVSSYYPTSKAGAIGWEDMESTLSQAGISSALHNKPDTYEAFQQEIAASQTAIVLISSSSNNSYWQDVPGHYINIYLYNQETDMVFLSEPGDPEKNRTWIPLRTVYDAQKLSSQYQYLTVDSYSNEENTWKNNQTTGTWIRPT